VGEIKESNLIMEMFVSVALSLLLVYPEVVDSPGYIVVKNPDPGGGVGDVVIAAGRRISKVI